MSFDEILEQVGGGMEPYQIMVIFWMFMIHVMTGFWQISAVLEDLHQPYHCVLNDTMHSAYNSSANLVQFIYRACSASIEIFNVTSTPTSIEIHECTGYNFSQDVFSVTVRSRYLLVCNKEYLGSLSTNFFFIGILIGNSAFGWLGDKKGRLFSVNICIFFSLIGVIMAIFSQSFGLYLIARFLLGVSVGGIFVAGFTLGIECMNTENRAFAGILIHNGDSIGGIITIIIGFVTRDYVKLLMIVSMVIFICFLSNIFVYESPRWLYAAMKYNQCKQIMKRIALKNKRSPPEDCIPLEPEDELNESDSVVDFEKHQNHSSRSQGILTALKFPGIRRILIISWFLCFVIAGIFFGMYFVTQDVGGGVFLNTTITLLVDMISRMSLFLVLKRYNRRVLFGLSLAATSSGLLACAITKLLCIAFSLTVSISIPFVIITRFALNVAVHMSYLVIAEVFPTVIRNTGVGISFLGGRIASIITPQLPLLDLIWPTFPLFILAGLSAVACLSVILFWPETKDIPLPETLEEAELLAMSQWTKIRKKYVSKD